VTAAAEEASVAEVTGAAEDDFKVEAEDVTDPTDATLLDEAIEAADEASAAEATETTEDCPFHDATSQSTA
jgi:hypothetical protein